MDSICSLLTVVVMSAVYILSSGRSIPHEHDKALQTTAAPSTPEKVVMPLAEPLTATHRIKSSTPLLEKLFVKKTLKKGSVGDRSGMVHHVHNVDDKDNAARPNDYRANPYHISRLLAQTTTYNKKEFPYKYKGFPYNYYGFPYGKDHGFPAGLAPVPLISAFHEDYQCPENGAFYRDQQSFYFCQDRIARVQLCAPGTMNVERSVDQRLQRVYSPSEFCTVNILHRAARPVVSRTETIGQIPVLENINRVLSQRFDVQAKRNAPPRPTRDLPKSRSGINIKKHIKSVKSQISRERDVLDAGAIDLKMAADMFTINIDRTRMMAKKLKSPRPIVMRKFKRNQITGRT